MSNDLDLAENYFFANWPKWLRWLLSLPSAIICSIIFSVILKIAYAYFLGRDFGSINGGTMVLLDLFQSCVQSVLFIYIGSTIAPSKQFEVSIVLLVLLTMFSLFVFQTNTAIQAYPDWFNFIDIIIKIGIAIGTVVYIHNETKK